MNLRQAIRDDLPYLKEMYQAIIAKMDAMGITIWDDIYPYSCFADDIDRHQLYVLENQQELLAAFTLCKQHPGAIDMNWIKQSDSVFYIDRFGVNVCYQNKGIGTFMLQQAGAMALTMGIDSLRLFVVDSNLPAMQLYIKHGFQKINGTYSERIDDELTLCEYAFEYILQDDSERRK